MQEKVGDWMWEETHLDYARSMTWDHENWKVTFGTSAGKGGNMLGIPTMYYESLLWGYQGEDKKTLSQIFKLTGASVFLFLAEFQYG